MTDQQFGLLVAAGFIVIGLVLTFTPRSLRAGVLRHNRSAWWRSSKPVTWYLDEERHLKVMTMTGIVSFVLGILLLVGILLEARP